LDQADNAEFDGDGYDGESDGLDGDYCDDEDADWQDEE
jgi:hypothetical protein